MASLYGWPGGSAAAKGQLISKANSQAENSSKNKQTRGNKRWLKHLLKGQLISKANCQAEDSSKKRTN